MNAIIIAISIATFIAFVIRVIMTAEETHYNSLVKNKPVKITNRMTNKKAYSFEVTRHEKMSEENYRGPQVMYENKFDKYIIKVNKETYESFNEGNYVIIKAKRKGSIVKNYK